MKPPLFIETKSHAPRIWLLLIILLGLPIYRLSQDWIGRVVPPVCGIGDALQNGTALLNSFLQTHVQVANAVLILYSFAGDMIVLFLILRCIWMSSIRPMLPLLVFLILRQSLQIFVSFPLAPGLIWHYPGFPSLFSTYKVSSDFYFSAYVGVNILGWIELSHLKIRWLSLLGLAFVFIEAFIDIILRSHYTCDIYTSIITAIFAYIFTQRFVPPADRLLKKIEHISPYLLTFLILLGIGCYYLTEYLIGQKAIPLCVITDDLQKWTQPINDFLTQNPTLANMQLIVMNSIVDLLTLFLLFLALITRNVRPVVTLFLFFTLRQCLQLLVALPIPPHTIWHYPGFPSLLQTYDIANDLYFSGHTGLSLIAALEIERFKKPWLTALGFTLFGYELLSVVSMQVHYTMDVFTACITTFCITGISSKWARPINHYLSNLGFKK